ncbi:hypothetical protein FRB90_009830 [Tulasnella sp. 427]|nr:hypothetical protein FRB90_009830 [Tulasnella sp. 427]
MGAHYADLVEPDRPTAEQVLALAAYMPMAPISGRLAKEIHERARKTCAQLGL